MRTEDIRLYDPTAEPRVIDARLATRLGSLAGTRVGILDNGKANAGTLMLAGARILHGRYGVMEGVKRGEPGGGGGGRILQERYGVREVVKREKPVAGPPKAEVLDALSQCDFALVGSAD